MGVEGRLDLSQCVVRIGQYLFVLEAQDSPAAPPKESIALLIVSVLGAMLASIGFDDEARANGSKVGYVRRDWMLATEVPTGEIRVL